MWPTTKSVDEVVSEISQTLLHSDGKTIEEIANKVLTNQVKYTEDSKFEYWISTDSSTGQFGRQISERVFEFKENGMPDGTVDLSKFSQEEIEDCIHAYGYTLGSSQGNLLNITQEYGDEADWVIAECLFESGLADR